MLFGKCCYQSGPGILLRWMNLHLTQFGVQLLGCSSLLWRGMFALNFRNSKKWSDPMFVTGITLIDFY